MQGKSTEESITREYVIKNAKLDRSNQLEMEKEEPKAHTPSKDINFAMCTDDFKLTCLSGDDARNQPDEAIIEGYLNIGLKIYLVMTYFIDIFVETKEKIEIIYFTEYVGEGHCSSKGTSRNPTPNKGIRKEEIDFPLGADADNMNRTRLPSNESQEEDDYKNTNNADDVSSGMGKPPSTAFSAVSNVSTGQLIPTSGM